MPQPGVERDRAALREARQHDPLRGHAARALGRDQRLDRRGRRAHAGQVRALGQVRGAQVVPRRHHVALVDRHRHRRRVREQEAHARARRQAERGHDLRPAVPGVAEAVQPDDGGVRRGSGVDGDVGEREGGQADPRGRGDRRRILLGRRAATPVAARDGVQTVHRPARKFSYSAGGCTLVRVVRRLPAQRWVTCRLNVERPCRPHLSVSRAAMALLASCVVAASHAATITIDTVAGTITGDSDGNPAQFNGVPFTFHARDRRARARALQRHRRPHDPLDRCRQGRRSACHLDRRRRQPDDPGRRAGRRLGRAGRDAAGRRHRGRRRQLPRAAARARSVRSLQPADPAPAAGPVRAPRERPARTGADSTLPATPAAGTTGVAGGRRQRLQLDGAGAEAPQGLAERLP